MALSPAEAYTSPKQATAACFVRGPASALDLAPEMMEMRSLMVSKRSFLSPWAKM
ncbi:hypothetical protein CH063_13246 [Colletotrichum higginsianum]|uniref:Uncharacterized protein n=1 Tax=Colletotrichum higginsianum (strain IMI 349063) TaxID=759273 RepID=H1VTM5_COLHI|nr:hypothetical protein CH063_13246 [Colletotrichum higginsianum]